MKKLIKSKLDVIVAYLSSILLNWAPLSESFFEILVPLE